ncbi:TlpA family protein disulfide reductase [Moheibacter sediminis]|uniref:Thiol-disulfide isomerase or thioredoxin n=1 Tax=Moheibacter sediminis TaxID=1434700 RepID=A0A1W1YY65_9FLAO|nr:TlpA disulfide reductase family protein [Moheibacter sediminis]SMC41140.1 Thiol-disulfide isomerase or thioredoxin [Moheibacter sediminis]
MKNLLLTSLFLAFWSCNAQESESYVLKSVNYEELKSIIQKDDGKLYVVNFWATWCKPCIEELPHFMEVNELYKSDPNYKMILVSLDNVKAMDTKVKKFIESNHLNVDVYLLDDNKKMNEWIPATDKSWSGAIPATIFYKNKKKVHFQELQMTQYELEDIINENL